MQAADVHNKALAAAQARLSELGLRVRDDLLPEDAEHGEGVLERGVRADGTDWIPVDPAGVLAHALRLVFASYGRGHLMADIGRYRWRPHEVEARADGLKVPALTAPLPPVPLPAPIPSDRLIVWYMLPEPQLAEVGGYYPPKPPRPVPRGMVRA